MPIISGFTQNKQGRKAEALGNFSQAFTHLALISAAFNRPNHSLLAIRADLSGFLASQSPSLR
jgi:hypothetical protein